MGNNIGKLNRHGVFAILRDIFLILLNSILLFWAAGTIYWYNAWVYLALVFLQQAVLILILIIYNPVLLNERGKGVKEGTVMTDKIFVLLYLIFSPASVIIAGFDAIRYEWTVMPDTFFIPGIIIFLIAAVFGNWAMIVNSYFETTLRIQKDRGHKVVDTGPYRYVRHPGYSAWILAAVAFPLILGSYVSFIPVLAGIIVFVIRTWIEDSTLIKELPGYKAYTEKTRFRLFPGIW